MGLGGMSDLNHVSKQVKMVTRNVLSLGQDQSMCTFTFLEGQSSHSHQGLSYFLAAGCIWNSNSTKMQV